MCRSLICGIEIGENPKCALEISLPILVRTGVPGSAVQELDAEFLFEIAHIFADGRARQSKLTGGFGEAAEFDHFHEGAQARELVHDCHQIIDSDVMKGLIVFGSAPTNYPRNRRPGPPNPRA